VPVIPEFNPGGNPVSAGTAVFDGINMGQSIMDRAQMRRLREAQEARQQEDFELERPVRQAEASAKAAGVLNTLVGTQQMADLSKNANIEMPTLRQKWKQTYAIADEDARLATQEQVLADAGRYSSLKGLGDEVHQWHEIWAQGQVAKRGRDMITGRSEVAQMKSQTDQQIAQTRAETAATLAKERADRAAEIADIRHQHELEKIRMTGQNTIETTDQKIRTEAASKANEELIEEGRKASASATKLKRGLELLDDPDVRTGTGANFETKVKRLGELMGTDVSKVKKTEELQQILGDAVLARVNQTKGSISDKEMALFDTYSASMAKTPEGNKAIISALMRAQERTVEIAKMINKGRRAGKRESEIQNDVNDFMLANDIWEGIPDPNKPATSGSSNASSVWTDEKQKRLDELQAKLRK